LEEEDYDILSPSNDFSGMEGIEYELTEDVHMEVYGPLVDIT
jgi:hypothetical protein